MEHTSWGTLDTLRRAAAASKSTHGFRCLVDEEDLDKDHVSTKQIISPLVESKTDDVDEGQPAKQSDLRARQAQRHLPESWSIFAFCSPGCCRCFLICIVLVGAAALALRTNRGASYLGRLHEAWEGTGVPQMIESHLVFILAVLAAFPYSGTIVVIAWKTTRTVLLLRT